MTQIHPILSQMHPSDEQRAPIAARDCDVAVTAGAGAGKTRTLVARYLALLAEGLPLRSIVAITFTKKAAREMRNRIRQEVRRYLEQAELDAAERRRWQENYEKLDAARIGTIHSLCAEILRHHPAEAGIDPRFAALEEGQMALLQAQAVDAALGRAADTAGGARLFVAFGERELRRIAAQLLQRRLDVAAVRGASPGARWSAWVEQLTPPIRAFVDAPEVRACFAALRAVRAEGILERAEAADDALAPLLREALELWERIADARRADDWVTISTCLAPLRETLKQKGRKANWSPADPKVAIKELQGLYDEQLKAYVGSGVDLAVDRRLALELLLPLFDLYDDALAHYEAAKAERQALDFDDMEAGALRLLERCPEVRAYWRQAVRALLVDEFQDTNARQRDLLAHLNGDAGKLFIVGDGKQSIYRFRGADVAVFRAARREIAAHGSAFVLATSYRAHAPLLDALNRLLEPALGPEDPDRPYAEPFARLEPHRREPAAGLAHPFVELHLAPGSKSDGALAYAARALARRLVELVEETPALTYGDVAILCRASSSFTAYEDALEEVGVPFLTISGRGFYDRPEVRDLLNALQALADPTDDLALSGLLRSPACGLSDLTLYRLHERRRSEAHASLWATLDADGVALLGDDADRLRVARELIARTHALIGRVPVADVLKSFLDATGYRAALLRAGQVRAANNVDKLLGDAQTSEIVGVSAFVEYVGQLRDVGTREGEAHAIAEGVVQIMSVHQAKGLEFPVVVVGDVTRSTPASQGVLVDDNLGVVPPFKVEDDDGESVGSMAYRLAKAREQDQDDAESRRLLYVAATRAQELLLLNGAVRTSRSGLRPAGWLAYLEDALQLAAGSAGEAGFFSCTFYDPEEALPPCGPDCAPELTPTRAAPSLPDEALLQPVAPEARRLDAAAEEIERDPPRRVWRVIPRTERAFAPAWVVGQLVHLALAHWIFPEGPGADFHRWAAAEARSCGLTDAEEVRDALRRAGRMLERFRATPLFAEMDGADRRLHELPYALPAEGGAGAESGVFDALFRRDGRWVLVEFKSDRIRDQAALDRLLREEDYRAQVARYLRAAERLLGERPRPVFCLLNYAGTVRLLEELW